MNDVFVEGVFICERSTLIKDHNFTVLLSFFFLVVVKANSIVAAAAGGLLKVPEIKKPAITSTTEQGAVQTGAGMTIADAAKSGFLAVPTAGEKKGIGNVVSDLQFMLHNVACKALKLDIGMVEL